MIDANELFYNLRIAFVDEDDELFVQLCNQYKAEIFNYFKNWTTIPASLRDDEDQRNIWGGTVIKLAQYFKATGHPELLNSLIGNKKANPAVQVQNSYIEAQGLYDNGKFEDSISLLLQILSELATMRGPLVDELTAKANGLAGSNYMKLRQIDKANEYTKRALDKCRQIGDKAGITVYEQNLQLIEAYSAYQKDKNAPLIIVRDEIVKAQKLSDKGSYNKSNAILNNLLGDIITFSDPFVDKYQSKIYGLIGLNYYRLDNFKLAEECTTLALQMARNNKDRAGCFIYEENLKVIKKANSKATSIN